MPSTSVKYNVINLFPKTFRKLQEIDLRIVKRYPHLFSPNWKGQTVHLILTTYQSQPLTVLYVNDNSYIVNYHFPWSFYTSNLVIECEIVNDLLYISDYNYIDATTARPENFIDRYTWLSELDIDQINGGTNGDDIFKPFRIRIRPWVEYRYIESFSKTIDKSSVYGWILRDNHSKHFLVEI